VLRILAGPLAGALKMPYGRFLVANACGGIAWAAGMTYLIWFLGVAAGPWLSRLSWFGLAAAAVVGVMISLLIRRKVGRLAQQAQPQTPAEPAEHDGTRAESARPGRH
jgi:membrane protein DedA with SNARE-associated domain